MNNRGKRISNKTIHLFLGLQRVSCGSKKHSCIRHVIKGDEAENLTIF